MKPAHTMGTLIRVWRREWAGLSRAQPTPAVSAAASGAGRVTTDDVYAWEGDRPPRTWPELRGLLQLMQRHGPHQTELDEFHQALGAGQRRRRPGGRAHHPAPARHPGQHFGPHPRRAGPRLGETGGGHMQGGRRKRAPGKAGAGLLRRCRRRRGKGGRLLSNTPGRRRGAPGRPARLVAAVLLTVLGGGGPGAGAGGRGATGQTGRDRPLPVSPQGSRQNAGPGPGPLVVMEGL